MLPSGIRLFTNAFLQTVGRIYMYIFFRGRLIVEVSKLHTDTPHSVGSHTVVVMFV